MRCACPQCGAYMPQGSLRCVCPDCGHACSACMGETSRPLSLEEIAALADSPNLNIEGHPEGQSGESS